MKQSFLTVIVLLACLAVSAVGQNGPMPIDIQMCGSRELNTYPLSTEGAAIQGLLLQDLVVLNRGPRSIEVKSVELELLRSNEVIESRTLHAAELASFGELSRQLEAAPAAKASFDLICGNHQLVPRGAVLAGPELDRGQAMLVQHQVFAFSGKRDALRVNVTGMQGGRQLQQRAQFPVSMSMAKTRLGFPVRGVWVVKSGPSLHTHHRWALPSEFALDLVKFDTNGRSHGGDGTKFSDYYAYGQDVFAAADGRVAKVVDDRPEPTDLLLRPAETIETFSQRIAAYEQELFKAGADGVAGNHVIIDHGSGEYSLYAHLQPGSISVEVGQPVKSGETIGKLGGSGNALIEPHLHFQLCDRPTPLACTGIPTGFSNVEIPFVSFLPRALQSGDIVIAK